MEPSMRQIEHLIVLMMENRSFDQYLGALTLQGRPDINGIPTPPPTNPTIRGKAVAPVVLDGIAPGYPDPPHESSVMRTDWNNGALDGFVRSYQRKHAGDHYLRVPMGYYTG